MSIKTEDMPDLISLNEWRHTLGVTENLNTVSVPMDGTEGLVTFALPSGWNVGLSDKDDDELTEAKVGIQGKEYAFTKSAILAVTHAVGFSPAYVKKTPGPLIQQHMNYWATHSPDLTLKLLTQGEKVLALTKQGITPFSNLQLFDRIVEAVTEHYGIFDEDLLVDYKSHHSLEQTNTRLIIPPEARKMSSKRAAEDNWCGGVQIRNSLIGQTPLSVQGYLFSWFCTNGAVTIHAEGKYNRKIQGQDVFEVEEWVETATKNVIETFSHDFDVVESLISEDIAGDVSAVLADIFRTYKVPLKVRGDIIDEMLEAGDTTYYGVMNAVTQAANTEGLPPHFVTALMEIGGDIAASAHDRCQSCQRVL